MENADRGDLNGLIISQKQKGKYISEKDVWDFAYQILLGVSYLHSKSIVHRDLKCMNILVTGEKIVKIADLGVSKLLSRDNRHKPSQAGTPMYLAPESIQ